MFVPSTCCIVLWMKTQDGGFGWSDICLEGLMLACVNFRWVVLWRKRGDYLTVQLRRFCGTRGETETLGNLKISFCVLILFVLVCNASWWQTNQTKLFCKRSLSNDYKQEDFPKDLPSGLSRPLLIGCYLFIF